MNIVFICLSLEAEMKEMKIEMKEHLFYNLKGVVVV